LTKQKTIRFLFIALYAYIDINK